MDKTEQAKKIFREEAKKRGVPDSEIEHFTNIFLNDTRKKNGE